jgi:two-component system, cell cycle sensor histidine kinase and response regulator CckA
MDGWILVSSEVGRGSTFRVYFPRTDKSAALSIPVAKTDLHGSETILVVEDQAEVRKVTVTALERHGYTVCSAADAEQAIAFFENHQASIQLVITDVILPGINGRELARALMQYASELQFLFTSGYTDNAIAHHGVLDQGVKYLQKPFSPDGLAEKVREILGPPPMLSHNPSR